MIRKFHAKSFVLGMIISVLAIGATTSALAASNGTIDVIFDGIKVYIQKGEEDKKLVSTPNIVYNGTTYIPLRAVSEMLGLYVDYDGKAQSALISDTPQSQASQAKFSSLTEKDPLSIVNIGGHSFKKYQDLAYLLKFGWFSSGLFGLELEYVYDTQNGVPTAYIEFTNKLHPDLGAIKNVSITAMNLTKNKTLYASQTQADSQMFVAVDGKGTMHVPAMTDPINDINDDIYVTKVYFEYTMPSEYGNIDASILYDFENETYTETGTLLGEVHTETNPLEYHVLDDKVF